MLYWIIQFTILSIILIFLVHNLINFFKSTLTVPKTKDLVNSTAQKYENIYQIISNSKNSTNIEQMNVEETNNENFEYTINDLSVNQESSISSTNSMKDQLKNFLKKQIQTTPIESLNIYESSSSNTYSNF